ncbi:unnamed protein product [Cylindrotheca closterium]|uniref:Uncharacterized protein n=1 Tax=Cylindrotheca closterium TaxID=2856 RepID=A0AAD2FPG8_9STRA|nr:unnamed protein product [Cylindrotheca closterium]
MNNMQQVIHQNSATVAYIRQHDYPSALESSASVLLLLQHLDTTPSGTTSTIPSPLDCLDQCMLLSEVDTTSNDRANRKTAFVYEQGILLPPTATEYTMVSAVVIFNSALAHQLFAQQQQDKDASQRYLLMSRRLYGLAYGVHSRACHSMLFQFVVINNMAVIDQQTGNPEQSTQYFKHLMTVLLLMVDQGCTSRLRHLRGFTRNVPSSAESQAAAAA